MEDARDRSAKMLDDYMAALEKSFEEHTADAKRRADMQVAMETEKLEREMNKRLSIAQLDFVSLDTGRYGDAVIFSRDI